MKTSESQETTYEFMRSKKAHEFDWVHDTQAVFRCLLTALSNPGRVESFRDSARRLNSESRAFIALAATLVDNETPFCVVDDPALEERIAQFTYGKRSTLGESSFVFIPRRCDAQKINSIVSRINAGTLSDPHKAATIFVCVPALANETAHLVGPGIKERIDAPIGEYGARWLHAAAAAGWEYPCGVDFAFVTDDAQLLAVPRLVTFAPDAATAKTADAETKGV